MTGLTSRDLTQLVRSVFPRYPDDKKVGILIDVPRTPGLDNPDWKERRRMAADWYRELRGSAGEAGFDEVLFVAYPDVGSNNADLPEEIVVVSDDLPPTADELKDRGEPRALREVFSEIQIFLAPTEYSTTAPLKNAAKAFGFRAATMPGFSEKMIPALRIDYGEVGRRVSLLKEKLDRAESAEVLFRTDSREDKMRFDLRHRTAHMSAGRFPEKGTAGNLPSGETYIVPYEGEEKEESRTEGILPVEIGGELVFFEIKSNRAIRIEGEGPAAEAEREHLRREPAYGNMAELGFGVLGDFGLEPIGEILLDEKLGLHVAFGRSEHFGGQVGPGDFSSPQEVIHLDRIYIPATQPRIRVASVALSYADGTMEKIMENGRYLLF